MVLAISNIGMVSCNGLDVVTSCASMRAGITRGSQLNYSVVVEEELDEEQIVGYPIKGFCSGFQGLALYLKLAKAAIDDMFSYHHVDVNYLNGLELYLCLPAMKSEAHYDLLDLLNSEFPKRLAAMLPMQLEEKNIKLFFNGHVATLTALDYLNRKVEAGAVSGAIIVSIDSLVNPVDIEYYQTKNRLKTPNLAVGLMPGEAAVSMLVTSEAFAAHNILDVTCSVKNIVLKHDDENFMSDSPTFGTSLADLYSTAVGDSYMPEFYLDLDGDDRRAKDWANAATILNGRLDSMPLKMNCPAECLGNTGAVSAAIAICNAIRSFARNYALSSDILILSNSEEGSRGAVVLSSPHW